jgi:inositol 1,4,5-triphosphate receptor type 1
MIEGGNKNVQTTIFNFLSTNNKSEVLFFKFNNIIKKQIEFIEENFKLKHQKGPQIDIGSDPLHEQEILILYNVLKFLQNCVEGHYLDLQDYFRHQYQSRNNYDMVSSVADLLRAYYYNS